MLDPMRVPAFLLTTCAVVLLNLISQAQTSISDQIAHAERLRGEGKPQEAIAVLDPMVHRDENTLAQDDLGFAWNVLGSSYQDLGRSIEAKQCFETAIEKLRPVPTAQAAYAAAMANLASMEAAAGQQDSARALYEKADDLYQSLGNFAGMTVTSTDLARLAYSRKDFQSARRYLDRVHQAAQRTTGLRGDDIAALHDTESALAFHDRNYPEALSASQQSIESWTRAHGASYFMVGLGYALRAQATAQIGDYGRAIADAQRALAILEAAKGKNNFGYLRVEMIYAQVLRAAGDKQQASRLQQRAMSSLADLEGRQCSGCTIDANGFR
jgi:tetratricopeptide (TPR) repeat protein